jgi:hypothetical protein
MAVTPSTVDPTVFHGKPIALRSCAAFLLSGLAGPAPLVRMAVALTPTPATGVAVRADN